MYQSTKLSKHPNQYFGDNYYLIGDSAFQNSSSVVTTFKAPRGHAITSEQEKFNTHIGSPRVLSEHTIGLLKGRFPWLRSIPMVITDDKKSVKKILRCIHCCIILHNMLLELHEESPEEWEEDGGLHEDVFFGEPMQPHHQFNDERRLRLMDILRDYFY